MARSPSAKRLGIEFSGPFFTKDPAKTFRQNIRAMMDVIAEDGQRDVYARIAAIPPRGVDTGRTRSNVVGRTKNRAGKRWAVTAVVGVLNEGFTQREAVSLMAGAASIEGRFHPFRRAAADIRRFRRDMEQHLLDGLGN